MLPRHPHRIATGSDNASFGPHRAHELLQLKDDCFASPVDLLHALNVFGIAGRQVRYLRANMEGNTAADVWDARFLYPVALVGYLYHSS